MPTRPFKARVDSAIGVPNVREVLTIAVGESGIYLADAFWGVLLHEHRIDQTGVFCGANDDLLLAIETYFRETHTGKYIPRGIFTDLEPAAINNIAMSEHSAIYDYSYVFEGAGHGSDNLFSQAFHMHGGEIAPRVLEAIRHETERTNHCDACYWMHSSIEGTGAGVTSLLMTLASDLVTDTDFCTYTVTNSFTQMESVPDQINTFLNMSTLADLSSATILFDRDIISLKQTASTIADITASDRFAGDLFGSRGVPNLGLVPFAGVHFFAASISPLEGTRNPYTAFPLVRDKGHKSVKWMYEVLLQSLRYSFVGVDEGKMITCGAVFRSDVCSLTQCQTAISNYQLLHDDLFVEWMPQCFSVHHCNVPPLYGNGTPSVQVIANSTSIGKSIEHLLTHVEQFERLGTFMHHYVRSGLQKEELEEGKDRINAVVRAYARVLSDVDGAEPEEEEKKAE